MSDASFSNIIATLVTNGFHIHKVDRFPHSNNIVYTYKYDKLGARVNYSILFTADHAETSIVEALLSASEEFQSMPLVVSDHFVSARCKTYTSETFFGFFGGIINTGLVLIPNLPEILNELGHNRPPSGLSGEPDALHELYVKECLQFAMESPTRRYGIDRSYQKVPDIAVLSKERFMLLLDSKAYGGGFSFKADDMKRFAFYVEDFRSRYSPFFGNILSFVVVSGKFNDSEAAIRGRSDEFYGMCNCKISCMQSKTLGEITKLLKEKAQFRSSIIWKDIFSKLIIKTNHIEREIARIAKDKLL
jgi:hypothetical protein